GALIRSTLDHGQIVACDVADAGVRHEEIEVVLGERPRRRQDDVGVAGGLVHCHGGRGRRTERARPPRRAAAPGAANDGGAVGGGGGRVGREGRGLAGKVTTGRIGPGPGVSISSANVAAGRSPSVSGSPRTRLRQRPWPSPRYGARPATSTAGVGNMAPPIA